MLRKELEKSMLNGRLFQHVFIA